MYAVHQDMSNVYKKVLEANEVEDDIRDDVTTEKKKTGEEGTPLVS